MTLVNYKVELKLEWTKYCVLSGAGADNTNDNPDNIIFNIKDIKFYVPVVTLLVKCNKKLSRLLRKRFKNPCIGMNIKQKVRIKIQQVNVDIVSSEILLGSIDYFF